MTILTLILELYDNGPRHVEGVTTIAVLLLFYDLTFDSASRALNRIKSPNRARPCIHLPRLAHLVTTNIELFYRENKREIKGHNRVCVLT